MNFDRVENHIYLPTVVEVTSSKSFRKPFVIRPYEDLIEGEIDACKSLADFRTYYANVRDPNGVRLGEMCDVTLHVKPHSEGACNLTMIEPIQNSFDKNADTRGCELVAFEIDWHASSITLA